MDRNKCDRLTSPYIENQKNFPRKHKGNINRWKNELYSRIGNFGIIKLLIVPQIRIKLNERLNWWANDKILQKAKGSEQPRQSCRKRKKKPYAKILNDA